MTQVTVLSFAWNIARTTPSVRAATLPETTPAARPAASRLAALIVDATRAGGADADADPADNPAANDAPENTTPRQVALRFLVRRPSLFAIPKASRPEHAAENAGAGDLRLTEAEIARIDEAFPVGPCPRELPTL